MKNLNNLTVASLEHKTLAELFNIAEHLDLPIEDEMECNQLISLITNFIDADDSESDDSEEIEETKVKIERNLRVLDEVEYEDEDYDFYGTNHKNLRSINSAEKEAIELWRKSQIKWEASNLEEEERRVQKLKLPAISKLIEFRLNALQTLPVLVKCQ